jgi:cellulose synthase/poly-beta-1,6-N-acetylglucosamine synthase-like glycosyltransferase
MAVFILIFFILMCIYWQLMQYLMKGWNSLRTFNPSGNHLPMAVSVIIPVRNEAANMRSLMHGLSSIVYPPDQYEILIVDDHSTDGSWEELLQSIPKNGNIRCLQLPENESTKKAAITHGVKAAKGELIVATDADCRFGPDWLTTLSAFYRQHDAAFIAAPVKMVHGRSWFEKFQVLDFLTLQGITAASVARKFLTMCNGANLAYPRVVFESVNGFQGISEIPSGDDMLLMHKIYIRNPSKVLYCKSPAAIVKTPAEKSWRTFLHQRIRWASKATVYSDKRITAVLYLVYFLNLCFAVMLVASIVDLRWLAFLVLFTIGKIIIEYPFVAAVSRFYNQQYLLKYFILFQPAHIAYTLIAGWLGTFGKYQWKGRTVYRKKVVQ